MWFQIGRSPLSQAHRAAVSPTELSQIRATALPTMGCVVGKPADTRAFTTHAAREVSDMDQFWPSTDRPLDDLVGVMQVRLLDQPGQGLL